MSAVALPPVLAGDCEIIDIDLTTRLLKLWQNGKPRERQQPLLGRRQQAR